MPSEALLERLRKVRAVILDGDGVLFTGRVFVEPGRGEVMKERSLIDGQGISLLRAAGIRVAFFSGEATGFVEAVAEKLNRLPSVASGAWPPIAVVTGREGKDKASAAGEWLKGEGIEWSDSAAMGDDLSDAELLERVGLAACPVNAHPIIRGQCHFVATHGGGDGAIRDFADALLGARGLDPRALARR